jgi:hypothetical protein
MRAVSMSNSLAVPYTPARLGGGVDLIEGTAG